MKKILITSLVIVVAAVALLGFNDNKKDVGITRKPCEEPSSPSLQPMRFTLNSDIDKLKGEETLVATIKVIDPFNREITFDKIKVSIEADVIKSEIIYLKTGSYKLKSFQIINVANSASGISASLDYLINTTQSFFIKPNNILAC